MGGIYAQTASAGMIRLAPRLTVQVTDGLPGQLQLSLIITLHLFLFSDGMALYINSAASFLEAWKDQASSTYTSATIFLQAVRCDGFPFFSLRI